MKRFFTLVLAGMLLLTSAVTASADSWIPAEPFEVVSADGSRVFRFDPGKNLWGEASLATAGVYSNTEPPTLIYAVEGLRAWAYMSDFYFSEDLTHFAFVPSPTVDTAVEFYANGSLTRRYEIHDLVRRESMIKRSESSLWWLEESDPNVTSGPEANTLTLWTIDGLTYTFDLSTGDILQTEEENILQVSWRWLEARVFGWLLWFFEEFGIWLAAAAVAVFVAIVLVRRRKKNNK
jgi:hypothetical protein